MLGRTDSRGRLLFLLSCFVIGAVLIVGRLAWWQIVRASDLAADARRQTSVRMEHPSPRGSIYDRSGLAVRARRGWEQGGPPCTHGCMWPLVEESDGCLIQSRARRLKASLRSRCGQWPTPSSVIRR